MRLVAAFHMDDSVFDRLLVIAKEVFRTSTYPNNLRVGKLLACWATREQNKRYTSFVIFTMVGLLNSGFSEDEVKRAMLLFLKREEEKSVAPVSDQLAN